MTYEPSADGILLAHYDCYMIDAPKKQPEETDTSELRSEQFPYH